ncbi:unnamed protein product [Ceutorhynchus assimilis]|uniref:Regulating synaptic membrane exocytosis protein 1 n=1 Tax=Ceutorhynchus assimilis TaxID=467358 RepID=A0A9N9MK23_9CUCU|nr:unnamed protein product [Ceutorhynchus assimilis]
MLPTNVMSFMKKMVAAEPGPQNSATEPPEGGTAFGKLRQTLSSSLLTAQDKVATKMGPRPSLIPDLTPSADQEKPIVQPVAAEKKTEPGKPPSRAGSCRVCLKSFKPDDFSRTCATCTQKVCEDCASYSKLAEKENPADWTCSVCRRKIQSRAAIVTQDSNESLLEIPLQELQRRHSEARLGSERLLSVGGTGLAPPRSPELRRHSDVSPASLKELEKLKGGGGSKTPDPDWTRGGGGRSRAGSRSNSPPKVVSDVLPQIPRSRRASRVARQHSYDDEVKAALLPDAAPDAGLNLPPPMPRRASAYDVFSVVPGLSTVTQPTTGRRASFRIPAQEPSSPPSPETAPTLALDDDRRSRRRGSYLPDIGGLRTAAVPPTPRPTPALEDLEATPRRQASVDAEAIRIVIHDVDSGSASAAQKRVVLRRDPGDKAHRTRGFGMRVVGGKTSLDGRLFAYIVWTVPGGPAEKGGLQQGDKVLEWGGVSLIDRNFEEVCAIMDRHTGDSVELLVEHATDLRMCDFLDEPPLPPTTKKASEAQSTALHVDTGDNDKAPLSPTRRKLPKTPEQLAKERVVTGRVQIQVWYHDERKELVVAVLAGDDLAPRDEKTPPEAYARLCLLPLTSEEHCQQTDVAPASQNPIWNANLNFPNVPGDELMERILEITLWDMLPHSEHSFLGECSVDLQKAFLDDRAVWCRLEDPRQLRGQSPRGSIALGTGKRSAFGDQRSVSDDVDSIGECVSLLHPDHAWGSRRGSSQSEQLEVEVYQLGKDFSRSLPGSRRSSFQSAQEQEQAAVEPPPTSYSRDRRRSSCTRMLRDPEEILKSLKAVKGELGRTMSLTADKRRRASVTPTRHDNRKISLVEEPAPNQKSPPTQSPPSSPEWATSPPRLGPGQIKARGLKCGEIKLGLLMTKGQLEVEVICARRIGSVKDTYVKCYLREGDKWLQKKKTRVARHSSEPHFGQTLKYQACDVLGRSLVAMLWERQSGFDHNQGLGGAEIALDSLTLTRLNVGWYSLFPIQSLGSDSNDSP